MKRQGANGTFVVPCILFAIASLVWLPAEARAQADVSTRPQVDRLDEIVVTARRREEPLQSVPQSVFVLTGEDLESHSATNLRDLQGLVPNLTLAPQQNVGEAAPNVFIRGIGHEDFIAGSEPGVAVYLDGVYLASTRGTMLSLLDIERLEVLRGPQGTLFGKNSIGGALQIITVAPRPINEGHISAIFGSFGRAELRGVVNRVLSGRLQARLSLGLVSRDGFMRRRPPIYIAPAGPPVDGRSEGSDHGLAGRLRLQWQADDRLTVSLAAEYARKRDTQGPKRTEAINPSSGIYPFVNSLISAGTLPGPRLESSILPSSFYETLASGKSLSNLDNWGISATADRNLGFGTVRLILAYRNLHTHMASDNDGLYFDIQTTEFIDRERQFSGELQFTGRRFGIDFTFGLFDLLDRTESIPAPGLSGGVLYYCGCFFTPLNRTPQFTARRQLKSGSQAIYGQAMFDIAPRLRATLGARYTHERKSVLGESIVLDLDTYLPTNVVAADSGLQRDNWGALTYRAGLDFRPAPDLLIYGSLSRGFRSGGFNVRLVAGLPNLGLTPFDPETALTYELGLKSEWLDRRLRFNLTLFQSEYRDMQLRQQTMIGGSLTSFVENAAAARIRGIEAEFEARLFEHMQLRASYGLIDPRYLDVGQVPGITLDSAFQRTPRHSFSVFLSYEVPLPKAMIRLSGDFRFRSKEQFQIFASPYDQKSFGLLSARLSYRDLDGGWSMALFGTNLTGLHYRSASRGLTSIIGTPRQIGIEFQTGF